MLLIKNGSGLADKYIIRMEVAGIFIHTGIKYTGQDGWPAIAFGTLILITGFFKPKRCLHDCTVDHR